MHQVFTKPLKYLVADVCVIFEITAHKNIVNNSVGGIGVGWRVRKNEERKEPGWRKSRVARWPSARGKSRSRWTSDRGRQQRRRNSVLLLDKHIRWCCCCEACSYRCYAIISSAFPIPTRYTRTLYRLSSLYTTTSILS